MRTSNIPAASLKQRCDELLSKVKTERLSAKNIADTLAIEFSVSNNWIHKTVFSYYGKRLFDLVTEKREPSREELVSAILTSRDVIELWGKLSVLKAHRPGLFDRHFGVSNFQRAKAKCIMETVRVSYNPSIHENLSLVCSQVLGDGSYDKVRGALVISHGIKQYEYLRYKAGLLNKAFPTTSPANNTRILTHSQGHQYATWYSKRLPSKITRLVESVAPADLVQYLTPRGVMLLCMDDAHMQFDTTKPGNTYFTLFVPDLAVAAKVIELFQMYGIETTTTKREVGPGTCICLRSIENLVKFFKSFIEPFLDEIPECMRYKTQLKI